MSNVFTVTREELLNVLNVSNTTLKKMIRNNELNNRLVEKGYKMISEYRHGKSKLYDLEKTRETTEWDYIQEKNRIKKVAEHDKYTLARIAKKGLKQSRSTILKDNEIEISLHTAKRYDNILLDNNYMQKDRTVYIYYNKKTMDTREIDEQEYKNFWRSVSYSKTLINKNRNDLEKYKINLDTYDFRNTMIYDNIARDKEEIAIKFETYKELQGTLELIEIIKKKQTIK